MLGLRETQQNYHCPRLPLILQASPLAWPLTAPSPWKHREMRNEIAESGSFFLVGWGGGLTIVTGFIRQAAEHRSRSIDSHQDSKSLRFQFAPQFVEGKEPTVRQPPINACLKKCARTGQGGSWLMVRVGLSVPVLEKIRERKRTLACTQIRVRGRERWPA